MDLTVGLFGARGKAKELAAEVQKVTSENAALRTQLDRLGVLSLVEIEERKTALTQEIEEATAALAQDVASQKASLSSEIDERRASLAAEIAAEQGRHAATLAAIKAEESAVAERLNRLRAQTVLTEDTLILQEAGVYEYTHPLDDSVAYKAELARLQDRIKAMVALHN